MTAFGVRPWLSNPKFQAQAPRLRQPTEAMVAAIQRALDAAPPDDPMPAARDERGGPMQSIAEEVAAKHGLSSWREIRSHRRNLALTAAKRECWWRCHKETVNSYPTIGRFFGFDHTTVLHAVRKYEQQMRDAVS